MKWQHFIRVRILASIFDAMTLKNLDNTTLGRLKIIVFMLALMPLTRLSYPIFADKIYNTI
jgi:hypothetical protein